MKYTQISSVKDHNTTGRLSKCIPFTLGFFVNIILHTYCIYTTCSSCKQTDLFSIQGNAVQWKELFTELNLPHTQPHCECQGTRLHPSLSQKRLFCTCTHMYSTSSQILIYSVHVLNTHTHNIVNTLCSLIPRLSCTQVSLLAECGESWGCASLGMRLYLVGLWQCFLFSACFM